MKISKIVNGHVEGFTMIELTMTIVIAGIMAAIALPRFGNISDIDVYNAARQAKSDIRYTQELAMGKYRETTITFTSDGNTYTITGDVQPRRLPTRSKAIFDAGSTLEFIFNAYGEPITGGGGALTISSGGFTKQITVSNITGNMDIL
ncbi:MAG: prepilin-type N-terminal cleavage/methylation domain-containing protein [Gammaproteobacteria bacterium]|nr:prepilin-type N-terminal cleavage/methylation domain-containing protein [Gammaproteobacteria bacterium]